MNQMANKIKNIRSNTFIVKGTAENIENGIISHAKATALTRAIIDLNTTKLESLLKTGKVHKFPSIITKKTYVYKMSPDDRIIFSVESGKNIIRDVIDMKTEKSILVPAKVKK